MRNPFQILSLAVLVITFACHVHANEISNGVKVGSPYQTGDTLTVKDLVVTISGWGGKAREERTFKVIGSWTSGKNEVLYSVTLSPREVAYEEDLSTSDVAGDVKRTSCIVRLIEISYTPEGHQYWIIHDKDEFFFLRKGAGGGDVEQIENGIGL